MTLTEKSTISNPYYVFKFTKESTNVTKVFRATDGSAYTDRYNSFTITLNTTEDLPNGTVDLSQGQYHYEVYESSTAVLSTAGLNKVEDGIAVVDITNTEVVYVQDSTKDTFYE